MKKVLALALLLGGCHSYPNTITPVDDFAIEGYLGVWYEIARLDHSFERGLDNVSARYSLLENGKIEVLNQGYNREQESWQQARGKAKFAADPNTGHLLVSFFGPFYSSYVVFHQEGDQHAFVGGLNTSYLWWLSRSPELNEDVRELFLQKAAAAGYNTEELIFVRHDSPPPAGNLQQGND